MNFPSLFTMLQKRLCMIKFFVKIVIILLEMFHIFMLITFCLGHPVKEKVSKRKLITAVFIPVIMSVNGTGKCNGVLGSNTSFATITSFNQYAVATFF